MKRRQITAKLLISCAVLLGAGSCEQEPIFEEENIVFTVKQDGQTKVDYFIDSDELSWSGNRVKLYDYVTGFYGTPFYSNETHSGEEFAYIDDYLEYQYTSWVTTAHPAYRWTRAGTHRFFGWLTQDNVSTDTPRSASSLLGIIGLDENLKLRIPASGDLNMTPSATQFDFLYSDIVTRTAGTARYTDPVPLNMNHLFSAIALTVENKTQNSSFKLLNVSTTLNATELVPSKGYVEIDYSGETVVVTPHLEVDASHPLIDGSSVASTFGDNISIGYNDCYDVFTGLRVTNQDPETYYLTWPQPESVVAPTSEPTGTDPVTGDPIYPDSDKLLYVRFQMGEEEASAVRLKFPGGAWQAGTKKRFNLLFSDKNIQLTATTLPWDYNEFTMDFESESISTEGTDGKLYVLPNSADVEISGSNVTLKPGKSATCRLHIRSPKGATLYVIMKGDTQYFNINPNQMTISGGELYFDVEPSSEPTGGIARHINLSFVAELSSGRDIDADSELIDTDYTFIRQ